MDGGPIPSADDALRLRLRSWLTPPTTPTTPLFGRRPRPSFPHPRLGPAPIPPIPGLAPAFVLALALDPWSLLFPRVRSARAAAAA